MVSEDLIKAMSDLQRDTAISIVKERLAKREDPMKILDDARKAMEIVGDRFSRGEYFIPDLIFSGEILREVSELVKPELKGEARSEKKGKFVLGTVAGDIHDIGKDIVAFMLDINGFDVIDLGVDVPAQKFVDTIKSTNAPVLGLSGFLTLAFDSMKETVDAVKKAGLRDNLKIIIGGGQIDEQVRKYTGADAYGKDAMAAVAFARQWIGGK